MQGMRKRLKVVLVNIFLLTAAWIILETGAYFFYQNIPARFANGKQMVRSLLGENVPDSQWSILPHPYLLYTNNPSFVDSIRQHNPWGYRNGPFQRKKDPNTLRILLLGGSTTYGYLIRDRQKTWPSILETQLQQHFDQRIEVINGGLNYATSSELLAAYVFRHRFLEADWVIIHGGGNDAAPVLYPDYDPEYTHFRGVGRQLNARPAEQQLLRSYLLKVFYCIWLNRHENVYQSQAFSFRYLDPAAVKERVSNPENYHGFRRNLDLLIDLALRDSSQVGLIGFLHASSQKIATTRPDLAHIVSAFETAVSKNKRIMQELAQENQIHYLNLEQQSFPDDLFFDYCHLRPEGEARKAAIIFDYLYPLVEVKDQ